MECVNSLHFPYHPVFLFSMLPLLPFFLIHLRLSEQTLSEILMLNQSMTYHGFS